jgi:O-acetyl-ADP-ribose deacetylase (regulator of RNase III)
MRVKVIEGSIVQPDLGAHAVVNASNPEVGLGSGVSGAIAKACGGVTFQRQVREARDEQLDGDPLEPDDCLVTEAGTATHLRWVLHVASVDYRRRDPETGGHTGPTRVRRCVAAALAAAAELARQHDLIGSFALAMPLLGAGHGGLGAARAAGAIFDEIRGFVAGSAADAAAIGTLILVAHNAGDAAVLRYGSA